MPRIIGLTGYKRAGKDTVAGVISELSLVEGLRTQFLSFAAPLKQVVHHVFGVPMEQMEHGDKLEPTRVQWEDLPKFYTFFFPWKSGALTVRELLQIVGTDLFRERFYRHVWTDAMGCALANCKADVAVITDCRFPDEAEFIQASGGEIWAVHGKSEEAEDQHASEKNVKHCLEAATVHINNRDWKMDVVRYDVANGLARNT